LFGPDILVFMRRNWSINFAGQDFLSRNSILWNPITLTLFS